MTDTNANPRPPSGPIPRVPSCARRLPGDRAPRPRQMGGGSTFDRSVEQRPLDDEYVFYDGPPFANGLPHYGHLLTGYVKDVVPRYQTMRGQRVERRFGWDTPRPARRDGGREGARRRRAAGHHRATASTSSTTTAAPRSCATPREWERYVTRQARWVDFENDYKTMDLSYMESVIWAFKQLWDKGLVYEAYRVHALLAGAPRRRCPTSRSASTTPPAPARTRPSPWRSPSIPSAGRSRPDCKILAWTTTPWTLPSNLALAVGPDIDYAVLEEDGDHFILGDAHRRATTPPNWRGRHAGRAPSRVPSWSGRTTTPLFPYFADTPDALPGPRRRLRRRPTRAPASCTSRPASARTTSGSARQNGIALVVPVDDERPVHRRGARLGRRATCSRPTPPIIRAPQGAGAVVRHETLRRTTTRTAGAPTRRSSTGRCRRGTCEVTDFRDRMVELNQEINWIPEHVRDGAVRQVARGRPRLVDQPQPRASRQRQPDLGPDRGAE